MNAYEWSHCPACGTAFGDAAACPSCGQDRAVDVPHGDRADDAAVEGPAAPRAGRPSTGRPPALREGRPKSGRMRDGLLLLLTLHLLQLVWLGEEPIMIWLIGITQLAYVLPASIVLMIMGRWSTLGGLWLGAVGTVVINMLLAGVVCGGTTGIGG